MIRGWAVGPRVVEGGAAGVVVGEGDARLEVLAVAAEVDRARGLAVSHYRQTVEFLRAEGVVLPGPFELEGLTDLDLAESVL